MKHKTTLVQKNKAIEIDGTERKKMVYKLQNIELFQLQKSKHIRMKFE